MKLMRFLATFVHICLTGPREPPEEGEMNKMTLPSRHRFEPWRSEAKHATSSSRRFPTILNLYEWAGKNHFVSLKLECQSGVWNRDLRLSKQAASTTAPGPPPCTPDHTGSYPRKHVTLIQCWFNIGPTRRRRAKSKPTLVQCLVFAGM